jgi:hypothetical protein
LGLKKFNFTKKTISKHLKKFSVERNIKKYSNVFKEI